MTTMPERTATLTELVAAQVRSLLGYRDMKSSELARRLGENDQWMHVRLKGKVPINLNDMHRIARVLDVGVHELLPPPDVAARATPPHRDTRRYLPLPVQPTPPVRPRDNRPIGRPVSGAPAGSARTSYLERPKRRRRDR